MRSRTLSDRAIVVASLLATLLAVCWSIMALGAGGRVRLDEGTLAMSRGSNQNNTLKQYSCNVLNNNNPCTTVNAYCNACQNSTFTGLQNGGGGGYNTGGTGMCGSNLGGKCNTMLQCVTGNPVGTCTAPPGVNVQG